MNLLLLKQRIELEIAENESISDRMFGIADLGRYAQLIRILHKIQARLK